MICNLCKLMHNPLKRHMLLKVYSAADGVNVSLLADEMYQQGLVLSGVSQYLKELKDVGAIRRSRAGQYVNYYSNAKNAPRDVRLVIEAFVALKRKPSETFLDAMFGALMNPFRAGVVAALAKAGSISALEICTKTEHNPRHLKRDLKAAVDAGLIGADSSEPARAVYHFIPQRDPFVKLLVSLC